MQDSDGNYWRGYLFISGATCFDKVRNPDDFYQSGKAFGHFQRQLAEYPAEELTETIVNFHNTPVRLETFKKAVEEDVCGRAHLVQKEIQFVMDRADEAGAAMNMLKEGTLPLRVTHNDTKLNNIMIDDITERFSVSSIWTPLCRGCPFSISVIPSGSEPIQPDEDEPDVSLVSLSLPLFEIYTKGILRRPPGQLNQGGARYASDGCQAYDL